MKQKDVVGAEGKYEKEVEESKKFNKSLYLAELSGNIFNDAMHTVDLMDEDRYKILTTHMENRRTLKLM
ncbi:unnamed protein product [Caenorhabditis brenneri]